MWDPASGKFSQISPSLGKRDSQGQAVLDGQLYVVGGYDNITGRYLDSGERYSAAKVMRRGGLFCLARCVGG